MPPARLSLPILDDLGRPREHCGVFGVWGIPKPATAAYYALYSLQHRGQESAGIASCDGRTIERHAEMGLVANAFTPEDLVRLDGHAHEHPTGDGGAIAHNRYSTTGDSSRPNMQPFVGHYSGGPVAIAHNGNIVNARDLRDRMEGEGHAFHTSSDTEVMLQLIAASTNEDGNGSGDPIAEALAQLRGAFSVALLFHDRVEVARDPWGWRPLVLGKTGDGKVLAASETVALDVLAATYLREVEPGEIVTLSDAGMSSRRFADAAPRLAHCVFEHVYFASPASNLFGLTVQRTRERFGEQLAIEAPVEADLAMPMPDSGRSATTGFARQSGLPYREGIIPNRYVGRTFIKPSKDERIAAVRLKLNVVAGVVADKRVVVVDDSIVRGTTTRAKMDQLRAAGVKEIHLRISCPPIRHPCFFGVDFPDREQLVATGREVEDIRKLLNVDSLAFLSLEGMLDVVSSNGVASGDYCTACYSGEYRIDVPDSQRKDVLAKNC